MNQKELMKVAHTVHDTEKDMQALKFKVLALLVFTSTALLMSFGCNPKSPTFILVTSVETKMLEIGKESCLTHGGISKIHVRQATDNSMPKLKFVCVNPCISGETGHGWWPLDNSWVGTELFVKLHTAAESMSKARRTEMRETLLQKDGD